MHIQLNGDSFVCAKDASISDLIAQLDLSGKRLAIELNENILPRSLYDETIIKEGDTIEVVQAIGGG